MRRWRGTFDSSREGEAEGEGEGDDIARTQGTDLLCCGVSAVVQVLVDTIGELRRNCCGLGEPGAARLLFRSLSTGLSIKVTVGINVDHQGAAAGGIVSLFREAGCQEGYDARDDAGSGDYGDDYYDGGGG